MEGFARQAVILDLLDALRAAGSWSGETHVQKSAYFLQEALGVPLGFDFILYRHGPFSFGLREELGEMRRVQLLDVKSRGPYGPSLLVSDGGKQLKDRFPRSVATYRDRIEYIANRLGNRDVVELERLGTALLVQRENASRSDVEKALRLRELKPHVGEDAALKALAEVKQFVDDAPVS